VYCQRREESLAVSGRHAVLAVSLRATSGFSYDMPHYATHRCQLEDKCQELGRELAVARAERHDYVMELGRVNVGWRG
jgi:hypothetical protein